jgi:succinate dehydrogenase/fumarate reductase flavoprotein subunit
VRAVVNEVTDRVIELEEIGLHFKKQADGKKFYQEKRLGSSHARSCPPMGGSVGMLGNLRKEVLNREVEVHQWTMITSLFKDRERVTGALGVNVQSGEFTLFRAKAIVLAAGSAIALQKYTSANFLTTGDAYVAAFEAGAKLANLEFLEFTLVPAPGGLTIPMAGLSPFTSKGGRFFNALGERFLQRYDPNRLETTTRAMIVTSTYKELLEGRGPIYMDPSFIPDDKWDMEMTYEYSPKLLKAGIDCRRDKFEWVPALHTFLGGVFTDEHCEAAGVKGLYASGESGTGTHGANRLSGNAIASCFVLGARSGKFAARFVLGNEIGGVDESELVAEIARVESFKGEDGLDPFTVEAEIKNLAWECIGVVRDESGLTRGIEKFREIRCEKIPQLKGKDLRGWIKALECANLARVGEMVARSALERRESRGQHTREDYPHRDDKNWLKWVQVYKKGEEIDCDIEPIPFAENDLRP